MCIAGAGVLTYAYLAIVARNLPGDDYSGFGAFWSLALIVGFGAFLPLELELARALSADPTSGLPHRAGRTLTWLTAGCLAAVAIGSPLLVPALGGASSLVPLVALVGVSAGQFLLRGLLLGRGQLTTHGTVLLLDSGLRVALASIVGVLAPEAGSTVYAWTTVGAAALAHLPLLALTVCGRRSQARRTPGGDSGSSEAAERRSIAPAVGHLLLGTLSAQVLLNASPVLVSAAAGRAAAGSAAAYVACFTLVRLPLFVAVPLQSALVPLLVGAARSGGATAVRSVALKVLAGTAAVAAAGWVLGTTIGPALVGLLFGDEYRLSGSTVGLLALGAGLHVGLLVLSQVLVATELHRRVAMVWVTGVLVAAATFVTVPDLVLRATLAFTLGTAAALVTSTVFVTSRGVGAAAAAAAEPPGSR